MRIIRQSSVSIPGLRRAPAWLRRLRSVCICICLHITPSSPSMTPLFLLPCLFLIGLVSADPIHIGLARRSHRRKASDYHAIAEGIRRKYNYSTALSAMTTRAHGDIRRAGTAGISVINQVSSGVPLLNHSHLSSESGL